MHLKTNPLIYGTKLFNYFILIFKKLQNVFFLFFHVFYVIIKNEINSEIKA